MSILIKGMEMPTEVCFVNVMLCNDGRVFVYKNGGWVKSGEAVPVPAHGRLIDADAFLSLINDSTILSDFLKCIINPLIRGEPTVIEAEEGE